MAGKYRVVEIPILQSPCRKCTENICDRANCSILVAFNKRCDHEAITYGVCDPTEDVPSPLNFDKNEAETENIVPPTAQAVSPAPESTVKPAPARTAFPEDMTLEQFFPPARMAQLAKPVQLSLFS